MRKSETKWKQTTPKKRAKIRYHTAGNIKVGIYQYPSREIVFWEEASVRKLKNFTKASRTREADEFAINKVRELAVMLQGGIALLQGDEARSYAVAKTLQAELHNVPLDVILREVVIALKLSGATSITECAKLYRMIHGQIKTVNTNTAIDEFLATLKEDTRHHDDLKSRLSKFKIEFGERELLSIRRADLERWLAQITRAPKTFAHYHSAVSQFMTWAQKMMYLPETPHEAKKISCPKPRKIRGKDCFTPEELTKLLAYAIPSELPTLALQAFMGIRLEELCAYKKDDVSMEWQDILWEQNAIYVNAEVGKTGERYIHNVPENLWQWLLPSKNNGSSGRICPVKRQAQVYQRLAKKSGIKWKHNGLRHGFGSYRMALVKNYHIVSEEMGNSPAILKSHYRIPKTEQEARRWFAITPAVVEQYRREHGIMIE
ncbi:MAG: hypothetical protein LBK60_12695 [Verrucomicrobiales bacterium]|nr:hypothetical protein [Verrucomicrobiales bacterium]